MRHTHTDNGLRQFWFLAATLLVSLIFMISLFAPTVKAVNSGSVGEWTASPNTLPQSLDQTMAVTHNGFAYVLGGASSGTAMDTVYISELDSNGTVGTWSTSPNALATAVQHTKAVTFNGYVYVVGGYDGTSTTNIVQYAQLNSNGTVGTWSTSTNNIPISTLYSGVTVSNNGYVYVMGGTSNDDVFYAQLNSNGTVGTWSTSTNALPAVITNMSAVSANGYIYALGGIVSGSRQDTVYYALTASDGTIGQWTLSPNALPDPLSGGSAVVYDDNIFMFSGVGPTSSVVNWVFSAAITPPSTPAGNDSEGAGSSTQPRSSDEDAATLADTGENTTLLLTASSVLIGAGALVLTRTRLRKAIGKL